MDPRPALCLIVLVALAGCGLLGGSSGTPTAGPGPSPATPADGPTPTAASTPTPTAAPTATPLPEGVERRTVSNESLGAAFELTGDRRTLASALTADITGHPVTQGAALECARASPYVAVSTNGSVADVAVTMDYDESMLPEGASESELSVFVFNRTVEFYLEMETTVDADADTARATDLSPGQSFTRETDNGTETITPQLDGTRLDNAFVVVHAPTFWEAFRTGEVPDRCG